MDKLTQHTTSLSSTENPYQPPKANLDIAEDINQLAQPGLLMVIGLLLGISIMMIVVDFLLMNVVGIDMPRTLSILIPTLITGVYSGQKYGNYIPRKIQVVALTIWLIFGVFVAGIMVLIEPYRFIRLRESSLFFLLLLSILVIVGSLAYGFIRLGESVGIRIYHKKILAKDEGNH